MVNTFSLTLVMVGLSLFGRPEMAADFGIIHGATVALFYSLSGNARSLILGERGKVGPEYILRLRCILFFPLFVLAFIMSVGLVESGWLLIVVLVGRRAFEWLAEIFLSEGESAQRPGIALNFFLTQVFFSLIVLVALLVNEAVGYCALFLWAVSPLLWCFRWRLFTSAFNQMPEGMYHLKILLPHFGSTAVIGISVYVLRVIVVLLAGREVGGDLFAAFALGGILGSVFAQALGPTLVHHKKRLQPAGLMVRLLGLSVAGSLSVGLLIAGVAVMQPEYLLWTGKSTLFWGAVGLSLVGSAVMVKAQRVRLELLQGSGDKDAFGSDMLANTILVGCVPFLYYGLGIESLSAVYLLGAVLSLIFYSSERQGLFKITEGSLSEKAALFLLVFFLCLPIFFQLSGGVYTGAGATKLVSQRFLWLPIPVSVLACYMGIVILGCYSSARLAMITLFFVFVGMLLATFALATDYGWEERSKLVLLFQYAIPMFALVLGQQFAGRSEALLMLAKSLFVVLLLVVPVQLFLTAVSLEWALSLHAYFFEIYQGLEYVSVVFVGCFVIVLMSLADKSVNRIWLLLLGVAMAAYAALSTSLIALVFFIVGVGLFLVRDLAFLKRRCDSLNLALLICVGLCLLLLVLRFFFPFDSAGDDGLISVANAYEQRILQWRIYMAGIVDGAGSFFLGHTRMLDRQASPSAYNYYLDFIYNFGILAILPIFGLLLMTGYFAVRNFLRILGAGEVFGLLVVVLFLLLVDNSLQVGMRQPYSGIFTFFLWGALLTVLIRINKARLLERKASG